MTCKLKDMFPDAPYGDIEITGSGEPGAEIAVVIEGVTETAVIGEDGQWEVVFDPADIPGGEREVAVVITAVPAPPVSEPAFVVIAGTF